MISFFKSENIKNIINNGKTNKKTKLSNLFQYIYQYMNEIIPAEYKSTTKEVLKSNNSVHLKIRDNVKLILTLENTNSNYTLSLSMALEYISDNIEIMKIDLMENRLNILFTTFCNAFDPKFLYTSIFIYDLLINKLGDIIEFNKTTIFNNNTASNNNNITAKFKIKTPIFNNVTKKYTNVLVSYTIEIDKDKEAETLMDDVAVQLSKLVTVTL